MSGSETGLIASRDAYGVGLQKSPVSSQPMIQNMRLAFSGDGAPVYKPVAPASPSYNPSSAATGGEGSAGGDANMSGGEPMKRKRGRPRKYGPDGTMALTLTHAPPTAAVTHSGGAFSSSPPPPPHVSAALAPPSSSFKKARGRPPGSGRKHQMEALGSAGLGFTPHVITVKAGEDVSAKIMSFSQHGPRAVCILSANGAISNVTLRQPATSGGTVTYEGRFEILSLSGSFLLSENGGHRSRTGGLSISLAGPDGRVLGGSVAGLLTAAAPVQVVVGSFIADGHGRKEPKAANQVEPLFVTPNPPSSGTGVTGRMSSPPSRGTHSESSGGGSPLNQSTGPYNNSNPEGMSGIPWK